MDQVIIKLSTLNNAVQSLFHIVITFYKVIPERVPFAIECSLLLTNSLWKLINKLWCRPVDNEYPNPSKNKVTRESCLSGLSSFQPFYILLTILKLFPKHRITPKEHGLKLENLVDKTSTYAISTFYSLITPLAISEGKGSFKSSIQPNWKYGF